MDVCLMGESVTERLAMWVERPSVSTKKEEVPGAILRGKSRHYLAAQYHASHRSTRIKVATHLFLEVRTQPTVQGPLGGAFLVAVEGLAIWSSGQRG
jgi:hypothetical protein